MAQKRLPAVSAGAAAIVALQYLLVDVISEGGTAHLMHDRVVVVWSGFVLLVAGMGYPSLWFLLPMRKWRNSSVREFGFGFACGAIAFVMLGGLAALAFEAGTIVAPAGIGCVVAALGGYSFGRRLR